MNPVSTTVKAAKSAINFKNILYFIAGYVVMKGALSALNRFVPGGGKVAQFIEYPLETLMPQKGGE